MPQSLSQLYVHLIFSTKNREPWLTKAWRERVFAYLAEVSNNFGFQALEVGGVADHVHILSTQSRTSTIADWVGTLKTSSSKWFKEETDLGNRAGFAWQSGYGVFSVSPGHVEAVTGYIGGQEEHHRTHTFQEEYRRLLSKYRLQYDERYVWD